MNFQHVHLKRELSRSGKGNGYVRDGFLCFRGNYDNFLETNPPGEAHAAQSPQADFVPGKGVENVYNCRTGKSGTQI